MVELLFIMTQRVERGQDLTGGPPKKRQFSPEARRKISLGKGGVWVAIERCARRGMFTKEIIAAVLLEDKRVLSAKQVNNARGNAMGRGDLSRPTGVLRSESFRVAHQDEEEIQKRVCLWLEAGSIFVRSGLEETPTGRDDWLLLIGFLQARRDMGTGNNGAMTAFNKRLDDGTLGRLRPWILAIRDATQQTENPANNSSRVPLAAMAMSGEVTAAEIHHARR